MKLTKIAVLSALVLAMAGCSEEPGVSTKIPVNGSGNSSGEEEGTTTEDVTSPTPSFTCDTQAITIDAGTTYQEMEGFGASDCWLPNLIGQYWTTNRQQIARWLFSQTVKGDEPEGIGLSMWRVNLGSGDTKGVTNKCNQAESYLNDNGTYNWDNCAGQRYFMQQAKTFGCEKFVLFSNSPVIQYTKNGQGRSDSGAYSNLKDDCYDKYADYLTTVAQHFTEQGYNISHISPVNEPQTNWNGNDQEGSGWQNSEVARLTRELDQSLTNKNLNTNILINESGAWDCLYTGTSDRKNCIKTFFSSTSDNYIGDLKHVDNLMCGHSYWSFDNWNTMRTVCNKAATGATNFGIRLWQTEWSMLDAIPSELGSSYDDVSEFDIAIYMSKVIHNDITVAGCTSWSYWTAMSVERYSQKNRFELIKTTPAGGNYSDDFTKEGTAVATHNLWVLGNYSLFVRPEYKRIKLDCSESKDFFASAYIAPDQSKVVVVLTNMNKTRGAYLQANLTLPGEVKSVYRYTTTESKQLQRDQFSVNDINDQVFVDPYSVTTIVYNF